MAQKNRLFTTITLNDFKDKEYTDKLLRLGVGFETAFLTSFPVDEKTKPTDSINKLKREIFHFSKRINNLDLKIESLRVHQPIGCLYHWNEKKFPWSFKSLKECFQQCYQVGIIHYIIHAPIGLKTTEVEKELADFRKKLQHLSLSFPKAKIEVEEIKKCQHGNSRYYDKWLYEKLMQGQKATILLDTYECDGIKNTLKRLRYLQKSRYKINSIHFHKEKHKFITLSEFSNLALSSFSGNLINEAFISPKSSFNEFQKTKNRKCVISNFERISYLKKYLEILGRKQNQ